MGTDNLDSVGGDDTVTRNASRPIRQRRPLRLVESRIHSGAKSDSKLGDNGDKVTAQAPPDPGLWRDVALGPMELRIQER